jgi:prepilin-type N-terminal cleavage/methylation domain-containing protein
MSQMTFMNAAVARQEGGFTLTELAVVLVIVALLIGGLMVPLAAQDELKRTTETRKTLENIHEALLGYVAANGRLPCPATATSNGVEDPIGGGDCDRNVAGNSYAGFMPAVTLAISPTDGNGYAVDGWGNRIRYAVSPVSIGGQSNPFTTAGGMKNATMATIAARSPLLSVCGCSSAVTQAGTAVAACGGSCPAGTGTAKIADQAIAVVYSLGKNSASGGTGSGEKHNPNPNSTTQADPAYVSHEPTSAAGEDGEFDDIVIWLSPNILFNRLIAAGQLP